MAKQFGVFTKPNKDKIIIPLRNIISIEQHSEDYFTLKYLKVKDSVESLGISGTLEEIKQQID